ncbi:MAG: hypothetical protein O7G87_21415, partial [bacterium]|nr:hypothetical protein [bacterium]
VPRRPRAPPRRPRGGVGGLSGSTGGRARGGVVYSGFLLVAPPAARFLNDQKPGKKSPLGVGPRQGTAQKYQGGCGCASALPVKVKF